MTVIKLEQTYHHHRHRQNNHDNDYYLFFINDIDPRGPIVVIPSVACER